MPRDAVLPTTEARDTLSKILARFRDEGPRATPVLFGDHRKPEAVVVPIELWDQVETMIMQIRLDTAQDIHAASQDLEDNPSHTRRLARRQRPGD
jgi:hypothetical protein